MELNNSKHKDSGPKCQSMVNLGVLVKNIPSTRKDRKGKDGYRQMQSNRTDRYHSRHRRGGLKGLISVLYNFMNIKEYTSRLQNTGICSAGNSRDCLQGFISLQGASGKCQ